MATYEEQMKDLEARKKAFMAKVTEQNKAFEEEARKLREEERERKQREQDEWRENLAKELSNEYGFCLEVAKEIVDLAWENGHSYGYNEVRNVYAQDYAELVSKSLRLQRQFDEYNGR